MKTSMLSVANKFALMKSITTIPLPIISMDSTVYDYKPISDAFPDDGLKFQNIQLNGKVQGKVFNNELSEKGYVRLRGHNRMEISFKTATKFKRIILDLRAEKLNEKLCIGEFKLKQRSNDTLKKDEIFVRFSSSINRDINSSGWLKITAYAKNGIAGEFEIGPLEENGDTSILKGKFKLPLLLQ